MIKTLYLLVYRQGHHKVNRLKTTDVQIGDRRRKWADMEGSPYKDKFLNCQTSSGIT